MTEVPKSLRTWFLVHFWVDLLVALPLFLFPSGIFSYLGVQADPVVGRIVAAAMLAIGTTSLIAKEKGVDSYQSLLTLKIIWSSVALLALCITIFQTGNTLLIPALFTFLLFNLVWIYYKRKV